jgi:hypothetical protein
MANTRKPGRKIARKNRRKSLPIVPLSESQLRLEGTITLAELIAGALASQAASLSTPSDIFSARLELSDGELVRDFAVNFDGRELVITLTDVHRDDLTSSEPDRIQGR